jgi:5-methylcytosine-specific restriction endonuclease McrA
MAKNQYTALNLTVCGFAKKILGYGAAHKFGMYDLGAQALNKVGIKNDDKLSNKKFVLKHYDYIRHIYKLNLEETFKLVKNAKLTYPRLDKPKYIIAQESKTPIVAKDEFLQSYEWRKLRMEALKKYGAKCQCCGATPATGAVMNVDHIKPRKHFPELALSLENLQVLCHECNHGKGNWDETDWRG